MSPNHKTIRYFVRVTIEAQLREGDVDYDAPGSDSEAQTKFNDRILDGVMPLIEDSNNHPVEVACVTWRLESVEIEEA